MNARNKSGLEIAGGTCNATEFTEHKVMLPTVTDEISVVDRKGLPLVKYACGHLEHRSYAINFYGQVTNLKPSVLRKREQCGDCMLVEAKIFSIRCALCGHVIMPGDGVALYKMDERIREDATLIDIKDGKDAIGCLRKYCCPTGMFFAGRWTKHGFESIFSGPSPIARIIYTW
jgi:DNA-directed RNA polymerase subunit N (RpoN/RPB10)